MFLLLNIFFPQRPFLSISFPLSVFPSQYSLNVLSMFSQCLSLLISTSLLSSTPNVLCIQHLSLFFQCGFLSISPFFLLSIFTPLRVSIYSLLNILPSEYPLL